ncbi:hypothetical protein ACFQ3R_11945 [Mesonia ostreae]|uniref:Uncharacterized protein n=1 Tax=Mesonia ostreae TaxID=861110 RepID=A0ABU2KIH3_9FLAO|nr:hypothetical protein [Mesonia ostreae]MDT0294479.1 hypothetical protein [Mesonia ostreae]
MKKLLIISSIFFTASLMHGANTNSDISTLGNDISPKKTIHSEDDNATDVKRAATITVNCEDGSSYEVTCDGCSTTQLLNVAWALCA